MSKQSITLRLVERRVSLTALVTAMAVGGLILLSPALAHGQSPEVVQVDEDWELVLAAPSTAKTAPQLETVMSPGPDVTAVFARTTWNYREQPDFIAGGMQLQAWSGDTFLTKTDFGSNDLSTVSETVSWTQSVTTDGSLLTLKIANGASTTWGAFGGSLLTLAGTVNLPNLNGYSTAVSVANSGITFGANRVMLLRIKEVRRYAAGEVLISKDTDPKIVYQHE